MAKTWTVEELRKTRRGYNCWLHIDEVPVCVGPHEEGALVARAASLIECAQERDAKLLLHSLINALGAQTWAGAMATAQRLMMAEGLRKCTGAVSVTVRDEPAQAPAPREWQDAAQKVKPRG